MGQKVAVSNKKKRKNIIILPLISQAVFVKRKEAKYEWENLYAIPYCF